VIIGAAASSYGPQAEILFVGTQLNELMYTIKVKCTEPALSSECIHYPSGKETRFFVALLL
jgi:hypothetical protein